MAAAELGIELGGDRREGSPGLGGGAVSTAHIAQRWYAECDCVHPDEQEWTRDIPDADYALLVDQFEDAHINLYEDGDGALMGRGCEKSYTDTRCAVCSIGGDYPDVLWPCSLSGTVVSLTKGR